MGGRSSKAIIAPAIFNDIAMFRLDKPIQMDGIDAMPICLPHATHGDTDFRRCYVTGWGNVLPDSGIDVIFKATYITYGYVIFDWYMKSCS